MRKFLFLIMFLIPTLAHASVVVICSPTDPTVANRVIEYLTSADTAIYISNTDALIDPDLTGLVETNPLYWKCSGSTVIDMTAQNKIDIDAKIAADFDLLIRTESKNVLDLFDYDPLFSRALIDLSLKEINLLRGWTRDFMTETAASNNFSDFKSRVSTLSNFTDRTISQFKTQLQSTIDSGSVDIIP